jgi:hypothetical protein
LRRNALRASEEFSSELQEAAAQVITLKRLGAERKILGFVSSGPELKESRCSEQLPFVDGYHRGP